jgi:transposase
MGDKHIHNLLVLGATGTVRYARAKGSALATWITKLVERKPGRLATVALANKIAPIAWAVMTRGEDCRPSAVAAA